MPTLHEATHWTMRGLRRLLSHLLPGSPEARQTEPAGTRGDTGGDRAERVARPSTKPHPNPRGPLKKYIERHHGSYRVRLSRFGVRNTYGPYKSLLAAVTARNRILRGWDMEIPD